MILFYLIDTEASNSITNSQLRDCKKKIVNTCQITVWMPLPPYPLPDVRHFRVVSDIWILSSLPPLHYKSTPFQTFRYIQTMIQIIFSAARPPTPYSNRYLTCIDFFLQPLNIHTSFYFWSWTCWISGWILKNQKKIRNKLWMKNYR